MMAREANKKKSFQTLKLYKKGVKRYKHISSQRKSVGQTKKDNLIELMEQHAGRITVSKAAELGYSRPLLKSLEHDGKVIVSRAGSSMRWQIHRLMILR